MVCASASVSCWKETPGYLCGPDPGWICSKVIKILFNLLLCEHQLQVACSHLGTSQRSPTDIKEISEQAAGKVESLWLSPRSQKTQTLSKGRCRACLQRWYGGSSPGSPWCWECKKGRRSWLFCEEKPLPYLSLKLHQNCQEKTPPPRIQAEEAPKAEKRQQGQETRFLWANQCQVHINAMILKNCYWWKNPGRGISSRTWSSQMNLGWHWGVTCTTGNLISQMVETHFFAQAEHQTLWRERPRGSRRLVHRGGTGRAEGDGLSCHQWSWIGFWTISNQEQAVQLGWVHQVRSIVLFIDHNLLRLLRDEVLPEIQAVLGPRRWQRAIFQQVQFWTLWLSFK